MKKPLPFRLMLITDRRATAGRPLEEVVARAVAGGAEAVQIREKDLPDEEVAALLERLPGIRIVNGRPELARRLGVGLHLPASAPLLQDRRGISLLGRSVHTEAEAQRARAEGVDYVVAGPVFPTTSKPGHPGRGCGWLARVVAAAAPVPIFAVGGLTPERVGEVLAAGAHGVAVRAALLQVEDPARAARAFQAAFSCGPGGSSPPPDPS